MGVIGPRLCLKTHWFTIALTSSDIRVCPATLEVAFTCCGHQSFFSERHALSIIWVPAREGPFVFLSTFLCVNCFLWWDTASTPQPLSAAIDSQATFPSGYTTVVLGIFPTLRLYIYIFFYGWYIYIYTHCLIICISPNLGEDLTGLYRYIYICTYIYRIHI